MNNKVKFAIALAIIGLIAGFLIFGKLGTGDYISIKSLFSFSGGDFGSFGRKLGGVKAIQQKVFLSGAVGAVVGFLYAYIKKK